MKGRGAQGDGGSSGGGAPLRLGGAGGAAAAGDEGVWRWRGGVGTLKAARWGGEAAWEREQRRGEAVCRGHGWDGSVGRLEVGDARDRQAPPVGDRVREWRG
jgi:hypothetical protein